MRDFVKTTILGGILFLLPLVVVVAILGKAFSVIHGLATPLLSFLPVENVAGVIFIHLATALLLVLVCFLAGLAAQKPGAGRFIEYLEKEVLIKFPPYALLKAKTGSALNPEERGKLTPVVVRFDDSWQLAYRIEATSDGKQVVFLPGSPDPWSGSVCAVDAERVGPLDVTVKSVTNSLKRLGKGAAELLHEK